MCTNTLTLNQPIVKPETFTDIMTIKAFPKGKQWFIEVKFKGDAKAINPATQDEVTQVEADLRERGWQVDPSVFHSGFNAKPANGLGRWWTMRGDAVVIAGMDYDCEELPFASSADLWPEADYGLEPVL